MIFIWFFINIFCTKIAKKGGFLPAGADVASGSCGHADVARGTTAWVRRGTEATWQSHGWPARGAGGAQGADTWQVATQSTRVHVGARVGRHVAVRSADGEPTGIVGPG